MHRQYIPIIAGIISSLIATSIAGVVTYAFGITENLISRLLIIVLILLLALLAYAFYRIYQLNLPGLMYWMKDRSRDDYLYRLLSTAEHSFEYMGATGSSSFAQGGKIVNLLKEKYESHHDFKARVLLIDPGAQKLIKYRKQKLGNDPNVLSIDDINSTIAILKKARSNYVAQPNQELSIKGYNQELIWHIVMVDRKLAVLGFYGSKLSGWKWPTAVFKKSDKSFFAAVEEQFDQRWHNSKDI